MVEIRYEQENHCTSAYDGEKQAGVCQFEVQPGKWVIYHTYTDPAYGGQGIARKLVKCVMEQALAEGIELDATCSYAKKVLIG